MINRGMTIDNMIMKSKREKGMVIGDVDVRAIPEPRRFKLIQNKEGTNMV